MKSVLCKPHRKPQKKITNFDRPASSLRKQPFLVIPRETSSAAKSEQKRLFSQANQPHDLSVSKYDPAETQSRQNWDLLSKKL